MTGEKYYDRQLIKIDTYAVKASQYNHFDETYKKKKLSERWNDFGEFKIQRDIYSAFLIMNVNTDLKTINKEKLDEITEKKIDYFISAEVALKLGIIDEIIG